MENFHDPAKAARDFLTLVKLWHTVDGLYIWEFVTTLDYEWSVFRGHRRYLWTIWVYSLTRMATLLAVIINMIGVDVSRSMNCQAQVTSELVFAVTACASASLLIVMRTIAIWERNRIVSIVAVGAWLTNVSFLIYNMVKLRSSWAPAQNTCYVVNTDTSKPTILCYLITDIILLLVMLLGLFRLRFEGGMFGLGRLLWRQGILWLLLATIAEVPPSVFILLNLNESWNLMFQTPYMVTMSIAATRMYRSLTNFDSSDITQDAPTFYTASTAKPISTMPIQLNRMEVTVHKHSEQYPNMYSSKDEQSYDEP